LNRICTGSATQPALICCISASKHHLHNLQAVFGVHLTGEGDSTPEAAAAEQAVKRARQGGAEGASGAVFAALEAAEAQHSRQQQGKHWCACPSCHAHTPVRSCILKQIDSYQHIAVLSCAALCCAVLCCAVLCCAVLCCAVLCCAVLCCAVLCCAVLCWQHNKVMGQMSSAFISPIYICLCMYK